MLLVSFIFTKLNYEIDYLLKIFTLLKQRKTIGHLDVFPFIILHSICIILYISLNIPIILNLFLFGLLFISQLVVFFSKYWSQALRSKISFKAVKDIASSCHVSIDIVNNRTGISKIVNSV
jgi:hypothetical protein